MRSPKDTVLDARYARNPFNQYQPDPVTGKVIPGEVYGQFGGSVSGPITQRKMAVADSRRNGQRDSSLFVSVDRLDRARDATTGQFGINQLGAEFQPAPRT